MNIEELFDNRVQIFDGQKAEFPCVYALYESGTLAYIGVTGKLRKRIYDHRSVGRKFDAVKFVQFKEYNDAANAESVAIVSLAPRDNMNCAFSPCAITPGGHVLFSSKRPDFIRYAVRKLGDYAVQWGLTSRRCEDGLIVMRAKNAPKLVYPLSQSLIDSYFVV